MSRPPVGTFRLVAVRARELTQTRPDGPDDRPVSLTLAVAVLPADAGFKARSRHFKCLLDGTKPAGKNFYVFHRSKRKLARAVAVAEGNVPNETYPVGTILQLFPFEAMVKRGGRFNPDGHGWEFFKLGVDERNRTMIVARGASDVKNIFGSCQGCHMTGQAPQFDLVCEGHGAFSLRSTPRPSSRTRTPTSAARSRKERTDEGRCRDDAPRAARGCAGRRRDPRAEVRVGGRVRARELLPQGRRARPALLPEGRCRLPRAGRDDRRRPREARDEGREEVSSPAVVQAAGFGAVATPADLVARLEESCRGEPASLAARTFGGPHAALLATGDASTVGCLAIAATEALKQARTQLKRYTSCIRTIHKGGVCDEAETLAKVADAQAKATTKISAACADLHATLGMTVADYAARAAAQAECMASTATGADALGLACAPLTPVPALGTWTQVTLDGRPGGRAAVTARRTRSGCGSRPIRLSSSTSSSTSRAAASACSRTTAAT
jgi:hypothetical protein